MPSEMTETSLKNKINYFQIITIYLLFVLPKDFNN